MKALVTAVAAAVALAFVPGAAQAQDEVSISLVHGIPGVQVDVLVGDNVIIDRFQPGSIADISSFTGRTLENLSVVDDGTGDVVIGPVASLEMPTSGSWSFVAHVDEGGTPVLSSFQNDIAPATSGTARLTFRHTAEAPAVDLIIGDQRPVTDASNGDSAVTELPAGTLSDAQLAPAGEAPIVDIATLDLAPNTNTIIYAVGSIDDDTLDFVVERVDLETASAPSTTVASGSATSTTVAGTTTTVADTTTTTAPAPTGVATGSPIDGFDTGLLVVTIAGLVIAGGAITARRRV
jgi:hypothetical protein